MMRVIRHPLAVLLEKPLNILIVSLPVSLVFFVLGTALAIRDYGMSVLLTTTLVDDVVVFPSSLP